MCFRRIAIQGSFWYTSTEKAMEECLPQDKKLNIDVCYFAYDKWTNFTVNQKMMEEIKKTGVTVYERKNCA